MNRSSFARAATVLAALGASVTAFTAVSTTAASAKDICGWYAIATCTTSLRDARNFANDGWGEVIDTDLYDNLVDGYWCVVSGPQSKAGANRDRRHLIGSGISDTAYIKRACVDESDQNGE